MASRSIYNLPGDCAHETEDHADPMISGYDSYNSQDWNDNILSYAAYGDHNLSFAPSEFHPTLAPSNDVFSRSFIAQPDSDYTKDPSIIDVQMPIATNSIYVSHAPRSHDPYPELAVDSQSTVATEPQLPQVGTTSAIGHASDGAYSLIGPQRILSVTPSAPSSHAVCSLPSSRGSISRECGATLAATHRSVTAHLRKAHGVQQVKLPRTRVSGQQIPLLLCPDDDCRCRFRTKACEMQADGGSRHATHVVDLVRHCMDKHLRVSQSIQCEHCGKAFSRRESRARHIKNACPKMRSPYQNIQTD